MIINYVAYIFDRSEPVSILMGILSILIDYSIMEKLPTVLELPDNSIKMLYAVHPLSNLQCVTCSSSFLATALLLHTRIHPLIIAICFWEIPLNYHGILSYLLQDSHSTFVPSISPISCRRRRMLPCIVSFPTLAVCPHCKFVKGCMSFIKIISLQ